MVENEYVLERYLVGLDLGQAQDYTAIATVKQLKHQKTGALHYEVVGLERPPLGTPYGAIVDYVIGMLKSTTLSGKCLGQSMGIGAPKEETELVVDATGCGRPVVDMLKDKGAPDYAHLVPCTITGGVAVTTTGGMYGVPKRSLVTSLQILYQDGRIKVSNGLELGSILAQELLNFKAKINPATGNDSFEAWREKDHDDMVLAVALAVWWADTYRKY